MRKHLIVSLYGLLLFCVSGFAQPGRHVVLISIDGFRPDMYLDKSWPTPNLQALMKEGVYADHLKSVFPAYTYPSHVAMVTGALPARSGICYNQPLGSKGEWNWYNKAIKVPTIWQALKKAGLSTASVEWPPSVTDEITYDLPEIWDVKSPGDRITAARRYATPGLVEEIEQNATGKLDSNTMNEGYFSLDENAGRAAGYIFSKYHPTLLAVHFACVDGMQHEYGREGDSVRLAVASVDRAIGDVLEAIRRTSLRDSTTVIVVGDHGFSTMHTVFRPNILMKGLPVKFIAAGGSAFLYGTGGKALVESEKQALLRSVRQRLDSLPTAERKDFRFVERGELDQLGADSGALFALAAVPGLVFSGAVAPAPAVNAGPGTLIQQNNQFGLFAPVKGGHHGYDPNIPDMYTGFITAGSGIRKGGKIQELCVTDISPLIAQLLGIHFPTPDGKLVEGILGE
ncbi:MAG TPA: ectonucleotide pyrophosphatase/phosphodiesterase [Puia sp.]